MNQVLWGLWDNNNYENPNYDTTHHDKLISELARFNEQKENYRCNRDWDDPYEEEDEEEEEEEDWEEPKRYFSGCPSKDQLTARQFTEWFEKQYHPENISRRNGEESCEIFYTLTKGKAKAWLTRIPDQYPEIVRKWRLLKRKFIAQFSPSIRIPRSKQITEMRATAELPMIQKKGSHKS